MQISDIIAYILFYWYANYFYIHIKSPTAAATSTEAVTQDPSPSSPATAPLSSSLLPYQWRAFHVIKAPELYHLLRIPSRLSGLCAAYCRVCIYKMLVGGRTHPERPRVFDKVQEGINSFFRLYCFYCSIIAIKTEFRGGRKDLTNVQCRPYSRLIGCRIRQHELSTPSYCGSSAA